MPEDKKRFNSEKMKDNIVRWVSESRTHYRERFDKVDEYVKRYLAKRSISGLMGWGDDPKKSPKNEPWDGASDIGIPIEAFTIEGLLPRFLKVCFGAKPIVWVRGRSDDDHAQAPIVQDALNFQVDKKIKLYRRMKLCFKNTVMSGDGIVKCVWEEENKIVNRIVYNIINPLTGELLLDETGNHVEVSKNQEIEPINPETGFPQMVTKNIISETKKVYDGPKVYSRSIKNIVIPKDAITADVQELDWIADQYERTLDWVKKNIGDPEEGKFDEKVVKELEEDVVNSTTGAEKDNPDFQKILITEWHGGYDINNDGLTEEIVVFIGSKELNQNSPNSVKTSRLLGWMITPYPSRPFFHYQIIPMDNSFYGIGIPEFLIGIRNLIDAVFNQMIDRGSISNNPPTITPTDHDPDENPFGPGAQWPSDNSGGYKVLELPKSEQLEFVKMEFLLSLVQKLFGVTDYSLGTESSIASNRTASGIMTIVGEGNIKFDDMIRSLQDVNEDLYDFIVQLNGELLTDEFVYYVTGQENVFKKINKKDWIGNFDFEAVGNSININREIEQNRAILAYNTAINSFGKNPALTEDVMIAVTTNFFRSIDMRNIKIPTIEEIQQRRAIEEQKALKMAQVQAQLQAQAKQGGQVGSQQAPGIQVGQ